MSSIVIDKIVSVPVSNHQKQLFKTWLREKYSDYESYKASSRNDQTIETYIRMNILTEDMNTVLIESEQYKNVRSEDLGVKRMQLYRKRIMNKIKYMKAKLEAFAYHEEIIQERERTTAMLQIVRVQQNSAPVIVNYTKKEIKCTDAIKGMTDDCCICMEKHSINKVIEGKCGHQMGKSCFQEWANKSKGHVYCPLCRGNCDTVWELVLNERVFWCANPMRDPRRAQRAPPVISVGKL